jgi:hypothetical protein
MRKILAVNSKRTIKGKVVCKIKINFCEISKTNDFLLIFSFLTGLSTIRNNINFFYLIVESPVKKLKINKKANRYDQKSRYTPAIQLKKKTNVGNIKFQVKTPPIRNTKRMS